MGGLPAGKRYSFQSPPSSLNGVPSSKVHVIGCDVAQAPCHLVETFAHQSRSHQRHHHTPNQVKLSLLGWPPKQVTVGYNAHQSQKPNRHYQDGLAPSMVVGLNFRLVHPLHLFSEFQRARDLTLPAGNSLISIIDMENHPRLTSS